VLHGTNGDKSLRHGELWHLAAKSKNGVTSNPRPSQSASFAIGHRLKLNYYANNVQHA